MAESIMFDKAKDFAVEIINMCKNIKEMNVDFINQYSERKFKLVETYNIINLNKKGD